MALGAFFIMDPKSFNVSIEQFIRLAQAIKLWRLVRCRVCSTLGLLLVECVGGRLK